jgi:FAD/FMN-containing dehydrogenase
MSTQATLDSKFAGELISPDHPRYDEARKLFNGMIDKRPALIARCTSAEDVQAALAHAREQGLPARPWGVDKAPPNFISSDERAGRLRESYGDEKFARLVALKDKYDPDNVFSLNQNIPPSNGA